MSPEVNTPVHAGHLRSRQRKMTVEVLVPGVTLEPGGPDSLLDADGSALVVTAKADDNVTDPQKRGRSHRLRRRREDVTGGGTSPATSKRRRHSASGNAWRTQ